MTGEVHLLDLLVVGGLVWLGWRAPTAEPLFRSVVLFIALGLLLAVAWVRLGAVDVALAEAAIGAGLTGALLLSALGRLGATGDGAPAAARPSRFGGALSAALLLAVGAVLATAFVHLPEEAPGLAGHVAAALPDAGASHPVTAVLLDLRALDTLLEILVLLLAAAAGFGLVAWQGRPAEDDPVTARPPGPVLDGFVRLLVPITLVVAGYLLFAGSTSPGGAFQAGAVLAAAGVLLVVSGRIVPGPVGAGGRALLVVGPLVFLLLGALPLAFGEPPLSWPANWARTIVVALEVAASISIAAALVGLFVALRGGR